MNSGTVLQGLRSFRSSLRLPCICIILGAGLLLWGCASTKQYVTRPVGSAIPPDKARIFLSRTNVIGSYACPVEIKDNGTVIGILGPGGSLLWDRDEGSMRIDARDTVWGFIVQPLETTVKAGEMYNVNVMFTGLNNSLTLVSADQDDASGARPKQPEKTRAVIDETKSPADQLRELKALRDRGAITEDEYQRMRRPLVDQL